MTTHDVHPPVGTWTCEHCGDIAQRGHVCDTTTDETPYARKEPTC